MRMELEPVLKGMILDEEETLTLDELSHACSMDVEWVISLVEEGMLEPAGHSLSTWRFSGTCLRRVCIAARLQRDLEINLPGVALALDLLDEIDKLRNRIG